MALNRCFLMPRGDAGLFVLLFIRLPLLKNDDIVFIISEKESDVKKRSNERGETSLIFAKAQKNLKKTKKNSKLLLTKYKFDVIIICRIKMALLSMPFCSCKVRACASKTSFTKQSRRRHHSETYMKERCFSCLQSSKPAESSTK